MPLFPSMLPSHPAIAFARRLALGLAVVWVVTGTIGCRSRSTDGQTPGSDRPELLVFAAASLRDALTEVGTAFESAHDVALVYNFAASNVLAHQLIAAPRADVFVSANRDWVDHVAQAGHAEPSTRSTVLSNALVVVAHRDAPFHLARFEDLATLPFRHVALGDPNAVPAGQYARAALEHVFDEHGRTLWSRVAERVVPTPDVRAAAALVEARDDMVGLVYQTDARATPKLRVLATVARSQAVDIRYEAAALRASANPVVARRLVTFLGSDEALGIFLRHGFLPPPATASDAPSPAP